jgi:hypothetical protein
MGFYAYKFLDEESHEMAVDQRKIKVLTTTLVKYEGNYFGSIRQKNNGIRITFYMCKVIEPNAIAECSHLEQLLTQLDNRTRTAPTEPMENCFKRQKLT